MKYTLLLLFSYTLLFGDGITWATPQILSTPGINASDPRICMDASGNSVATWIENDVVMANTQSYQGSWTNSPIQVSGIGAISLELAIDPAGNATAIWSQNGVIQSASLSLNGSWTSPVNLSTNGGSMSPTEIASSPQISVDNGGNLAAIWSYNGVIQVVTKRFNQAWSAIPTSVSDPLSPSDSPQIVIGGNENIVAVWHSTWNAVDAIYSSSSTLDAAWPSYASLISTRNTPSVYPQITIDLQGNPLAAWYRYELDSTNYSNVCVQTVFGNSDTTWNTPTDLSSPGLRNPEDLVLQVAFNQKNIALVLWTNSYDSTTFTLEGCVYTSGAWIPVIEFVSSNLYLYDQEFAISASGYAYLSYMQYDPVAGEPVIQAFQANTYNIKPAYGTPVTISTSGSNGYPRIDGTLVDPIQSVAAIWLNYNGSNAQVQAAIGSALPIATPTSLVVTQNSANYGLFTEYYNTLTWQSSTQDSTSNWVVFRNGVWLQSLPATTLEFIDHNAEENQAVVYGVALQLQDGDMGPIATVSFP